MTIKYTLIGLLFCLGIKLNAADITLVVKNIKEVKGDLAFAVYEKPDWLNEEQFSYATREKVKNSTTEITIKDVEPGRYAIAGYQDINLNDKLDKNFIGMPKEPLGFSNGATIGLSAPDFEDAIITVTKGGKNRFEIILD